MLPLLANAPVFAAGVPFADTGKAETAVMSSFADGLLSGWGSKSRSADRQEVQIAQAGDPRVGQLQEQIRSLSGKIEELNFQIMQLQEQMRKQQEDNEFRFQELEKKKKADVGDKSDRTVASAQPANGPEASQDASSVSPEDKSPAKNDTAMAQSTDNQPAINSGNGADSMATGSDTNGAGRGAAPQTLGSIQFDASGNVIGETLSATPQQQPAQGGGSAAAGGAAAGTAVASLPKEDNPNALYQSSYQLLLGGNYKAAEAGFNEHIKRYPADPQTAEARYWLGESIYAQGKYPQAARVFLDTQRDYPDSKRGAENMFKLGLTMEKMDNREVACATLAQIPQRYPKAAPAVLKRIADERSRIKC